MPKASKTTTPISTLSQEQEAATPSRKPARSMIEIPREVLARISQGLEPTMTLVEILAADFNVLLASVCSKTSKAFPKLFTREDGEPMGVVERMKVSGKALHEVHGRKGILTFASHPSDIVRGWASYMIGHIPDLEIQEYLRHIRPFADDPHSGVREWAWMAIRPHIAHQLLPAILSLEPWTRESSPFLRRFAIESTRPRGVWCQHISALREEPEIALPLLENVSQDPTKYVQDSCANWLNDASKSRPNWVRTLCASWSTSPNAATQRICTRAMRTLHKANPLKSSSKASSQSGSRTSSERTGAIKGKPKSPQSSKSQASSKSSVSSKPPSQMRTPASNKLAEKTSQKGKAARKVPTRPVGKNTK